MGKELGKKIRDLRKSEKLTQIQVAKDLDVTRNAVSLWESGTNTPAITNLIGLSKLFKVPLVTLADHGVKQATNMGQDEWQLIPIIDFIQAGEFSHVADAYTLGDGSDFVAIPKGKANNAYALEIVGDSMEPEFREGDIIVVEPRTEADPGQYVIAKLDSDEEATFKEYRPRGTDQAGQPVFDLVPLNPHFSTITINADTPGRIIAILKLKIRTY